ncbi:hypothetical protein Hanom_Chr17g01572881 [Helianthus anomalus]
MDSFGVEIQAPVDSSGVEVQHPVDGSKFHVEIEEGEIVGDDTVPVAGGDNTVPVAGGDNTVPVAGGDDTGPLAGGDGLESINVLDDRADSSEFFKEGGNFDGAIFGGDWRGIFATCMEDKNDSNVFNKEGKEYIGNFGSGTEGCCVFQSKDSGSKKINGGDLGAVCVGSGWFSRPNVKKAKDKGPTESKEQSSPDPFALNDIIWGAGGKKRALKRRKDEVNGGCIGKF